MTDPTQPNPNREVESGDIKNLRFYADIFKQHQWQTDILHWTVFEATLREIAERYAALQSELSALKGEVEELRAYVGQVVHEWRQHPNLIMYSTFEIRMDSAVNVLAKAALAKGEAG